MNRSRQVDLDNAADGMVLAAQVVDGQGNVLLANGTVLAAPLLNALRRRGIDSVRVVDDSVTGEQLAAERARIRARLDELFRKPHAGAANALLREQLAAWRLEALE
jgi:uncharacterized phage protein gp47/JayE